MTYKYQHFYKGYSLERSGTKEYPWNIYRPAGHYKAGPYKGQVKWEHVGFERSLKACKALINSGAIELCDMMCPGTNWNN